MGKMEGKEFGRAGNTGCKTVLSKGLLRPVSDGSGVRKVVKEGAKC